MGKIVGGFVVPHDPLVFINPRKRPRDHLLGAYQTIRERVVELRADAAVIIGADHYILFGPRCLPQILIGVGELHGPVDQLPGLPDRPIPHDAELAEHIVDTAHACGFDVAVARTLGVDHAIGTPAHLCLPADGSVRTIPVYMASGVAPYVRMERAHAFGALLKAAVEARDDDTRMVVIGSGGISHWVGTGEMGRINPEFDRLVLDALVAGDPAPLLALSDEEILRDGGNGGMEIRHFVTAMGAVPGARGEVIAYEAWDGGVTGLGFAELRLVA